LWYFNGDAEEKRRLSLLNRAFDRPVAEVACLAGRRGDAYMPLPGWNSWGKLIGRIEEALWMSTKSNIILSAAIAMGLLGSAASPVLAEYDYGLYGGPHQTWCDVDPNCNGWNKALHGSRSAGRARAFVVAPKHHPVHKRGGDSR
jgi:hypothetical protein